MEYKRFQDRIVARIDRGEEIHAQLKELALREQIRLAEVSALGAVNDFTVGVFKTDERKYYANHFTGSFEIVSLTGTITTQDGAYYAHLHMSAGNDKGEVFGGHLNEAIVSAMTFVQSGMPPRLPAQDQCMLSHDISACSAT